MKWYKTLDIHQRINLKELSKEICGIPFVYLIKFFGFIDSVQLLYEKLKLEGFEV